MDECKPSTVDELFNWLFIHLDENATGECEESHCRVGEKTTPPPCFNLKARYDANRFRLAWRHQGMERRHEGRQGVMEGKESKCTSHEMARGDAVG